MTSLSWLLQGSGLVAKADMHRFMKECLMKVGCPEEHAKAVADNLLEADYRGIFSHGFNRLDLHLSQIKRGLCDSAATPVILSESPATAWVDGCNGMGPVVGNFCMQLATRKAQETGVSAVAVKGSNHFGICSHYANQALKNGLIGFVCSNTVPCVTPTRAKKPFLGTNPLCLAAPSLCGDSFVLDMATSSITLGTVDLMNIVGKPLPSDWAYDRQGRVTSDPAEARLAASLLPLGGEEKSAGYKGTGLAFMVEALCGILAGGAYGIDIPRWFDKDDERPASLSHFFMAIDPKMYAPAFEGRLFELMAQLRDFRTRDQTQPILVAGDPERAAMKKVDFAGGISYHSKQLQHMEISLLRVEMTTPTWLTQGAGLVAKDDMRRFMKECLEKAGALEDHAQLTADVLINADYQGQFSHGLNHLELYVRQLHTGQCDGQALPHLLAERPAGAWVDGGNALGPVVADFCMRIAIAKAREMGVALVAAKGSNTYGLGSFYTMQAVEKGLIGLIFTNEGPGLAPPGCRKPFLGANPISFAAPGQYKDAFMMNMACSRVCLGKVALRRRQQEWLPRGWALDEFDNVTRDPVEAMRNKRLLPLGCETAGTAGHKGFGLAFMAEVLSGILAGGAVGPDIPHWRTKFDQPVNLSHCFIVIDPSFFAPDYEARLYNMSYRMRGQDPVDHKRKILVAGDVEREHMRKVDHQGGIRYHTNLIKHAMALAQFLGVKPVTIK